MPRTTLLYLTGAPASGKTTAAEWLKSSVPNLVTFDYGENLRSLISSRLGRSVGYDELRNNSDKLIQPADVREVDEQLIQWCSASRVKSNIVIDSHAVTRETFGFRVTPFQTDQIQRLRPDVIVSLFLPPEHASLRIGDGLQGRLPVSEFEAGFHSALQGAIACTYSVAAGRPVYFIDASRPEDETRRMLTSFFIPSGQD